MVHVFQIIVYSWSNTMHLLIRSSYVPTCYGGGHHHQQRTQHHRSNKHRYWKVSILSCTHRYIVGPPLTHLPCMLEYGLTVSVYALRWTNCRQELCMLDMTQYNPHHGVLFEPDQQQALLNTSCKSTLINIINK